MDELVVTTHHAWDGIWLTSTEPQTIDRGPGRSQGGAAIPGPQGRFPVRCQAAEPDASSSSPAPGLAVRTTGPPSVIATVCSKWALGIPSIVDCVQ